MEKYINKFLKLDRRWIFLLLAATIFGPIIKPLNLPNISTGSATKAVFDYIETVPEGGFALISLDYDPATRPELHPQAMAVVRHLFKRNVRVAVMTFLPGATGLIAEIFEKVPKEYGKKAGVDYVVLPYQPNYVAVMTQLGSDLYGIYNVDIQNRSIKDMPVMKGIKNYHDMDFVMCITGTALLDVWVAYAGDKFNVPMMGGVTAVSQPGYGPYLQKGQLKGLIGGMKGAADYEALLKKLGKGTRGIDALNLAHFLVLFLIIAANVLILILKRL